jgi:diguanylate cyclase (GGDEF)-like protein
MPVDPREKYIEDSTLGQLRPVLEVVKAINREIDLAEGLAKILEAMVGFSKARRGALISFSDGGFKVKSARDRSGGAVTRRDLAISRTVLKAARLTGKTVVAADARTDARLKLVDSVHRLRITSVLCVPVRLRDKPVGAFYLEDPDAAGTFGRREVDLAEILADHAAIAIENARLHHQNVRDRLTRLFNHGYFGKRLEKELERARRHHRAVGALMIDLDDFKGINDTYGHEAGNQVLQHVARTLTATVRAADLVARVEDRPLRPTVARYGGDEFEIILPGAGREGTRRVSDRVVEALGGRRLRIGEHKLRLSVSVGGAVFPHDAGDARDLMQRADEALYESKRSGKNRAVMYRAGLAAAPSRDGRRA